MIGCEVINSPLLVTLPHSGDGGCAPKPKNDNELMYKMIFPKSTIIITNIDGKTFGNKCLNKIFKVETLKICHPYTIDSFLDNPLVRV